MTDELRSAKRLGVHFSRKQTHMNNAIVISLAGCGRRGCLANHHSPPRLCKRCLEALVYELACATHAKGTR